MADALRPYLVRKEPPAAPAPVVEQPVASPVVHTLERVVEKSAPAAKPSAWRFEVVRGDDNLITEIIATPVA